MIAKLLTDSFSMGSTIQKQRNDPRPLHCTGLYCMKKMYCIIYAKQVELWETYIITSVSQKYVK